MRSLKITLTDAKANQDSRIRHNPAIVACNGAPKVKNCTRPSLRTYICRSGNVACNQTHARSMSAFTMPCNLCKWSSPTAAEDLYHPALERNYKLLVGTRPAAS